MGLAQPVGFAFPYNLLGWRLWSVPNVFVTSPNRQHAYSLQIAYTVSKENQGLMGTSVLKCGSFIKPITPQSEASIEIRLIVVFYF